ncbi:hypothetical protein [Blautia luti]|uniref:hypothetical protein n=1 Tax=Blautia luti TaxID=89014 RepID=UPI0018AB711F|nr:hypothetical protein [Blautia luti]
MDYQVVTVGNIIKRFLIGWIIAGVLLVVVSCIKYKEYIITAFANNTWAWIDAIMPVVIMVFAIGYVIRSLFR